MMDFSLALEYIKGGARLSRKGWNGKGMFVFLVQGSKFIVGRKNRCPAISEGTEVEYCPHIDIKTADGKIVPWLASQTDLLADDWGVVSS
jgi:Protein of unknown function (DUF2829)